MQLECAFPSSVAAGESYPKYRCLDTLKWDGNVSKPTLVTCTSKCIIHCEYKM